MNGWRGWSALLISALLHAGVAAILAATLVAREVPSGPPPVASFGLTADSVSRERAQAAAPEAAPAPTRLPDSVALGGGDEVGLGTAVRADPAVEAVAARDLRADPAIAVSRPVAVLRPTSPPGEEALATPFPREPAPARRPAAPAGSALQLPVAEIAERPANGEAAAPLSAVAERPSVGRVEADVILREATGGGRVALLQGGADRAARPPVPAEDAAQPDPRPAEVEPTAPIASTAPRRQFVSTSAGIVEAIPVAMAAGIPAGSDAAVSRIHPTTNRAAWIEPPTATVERRLAISRIAGAVPAPPAAIVPRAASKVDKLGPVEAEGAVEMVALRPEPSQIRAGRPVSLVAAAMAMTGVQRSPPRLPEADTTAVLQPPASPAVGASPTAIPVVREGAGGANLAAVVPKGPRVAPERPEVAAAPAPLGWTGGLSETVDPASLRAAQAFVAPRDAAAGGPTARDAIDDVLTGLACARVRATFDPETGTLRLRGHVPDAATGASLTERLETLVGTAIPLDADLRLLPPPQCEALPLVAALGLPQSDAHVNDPTVVGPDAFVREETYREGERVQLDLQAPDYPAFLYVDYFDASGAVIHLLPNEHLPTGRLPPDATVKLGGRIEDGAAFEMLVSPPFHKEIAVAYAANEPLYEGTRPLSEPAAPYLDWLHDRIAEAKARSPAFRGEWAYVFITTEPRETR